jgi:hypothetical protein
MAVADIIGQIRAHGIAAGNAAVDRAGDGIVSVARADVPGIAATYDHGTVTLTAPGLRTRAFGTRRQCADPRIAGLAATYASWRAKP